MRAATALKSHAGRVGVRAATTKEEVAASIAAWIPSDILSPGVAFISLLGGAAYAFGAATSSAKAARELSKSTKEDLAKALAAQDANLKAMLVAEKEVLAAQAKTVAAQAESVKTEVAAAKGTLAAQAESVKQRAEAWGKVLDAKMEAFERGAPVAKGPRFGN